jgi:outer membrane cobalamin receptor
VGNLLAQTPQHVIAGMVAYRPAPKWELTAEARYCDRQFEDDQNSRELAPYTTLDAAVSYEFSTHATAAVKIENLFDADIETGKSATGLTSIGTPRLVTVVVRVRL